jgi:hypothetical protein
MTTEMLIQKVREELGRPLNAREEQILVTTLKIWQNAQAEQSRRSSDKNFVKPKPASELHEQSKAHPVTKPSDQHQPLAKNRQIYLIKKRNKRRKLMIATAQFASRTL